MLSLVQRIQDSWDDCQRCVLSRMGRRNVVIGEGPVPANLMLIGEGPGSSEDKAGRPFVGESGQLMRQLALDVGVDLGLAYISNLVACRPPNNRVPMPDEIENCKPRLDALVAVVNPKVVVLVGGTVLMAILGKSGITRHRGKWVESSWTWKGQSRIIPTMPVLHPAGLLPGRLRSDKDLELLQSDLLAAWTKAQAL